MARGGTIFIALLLMLAAGLSALTSGLETQVLSNEVRSPNPAWNSNFELHLVPFCADESLSVRVTYHDQPAADKIVALYSYDGGRHLLSTVKTTADGWAVFAPKPAGRYDLVATSNAGNLVIVTGGLVQTVDYSNDSLGQIFFKIPSCISPPSGAGRDESNAQASRAPAGDSPILVQNYDSGISREFYAVWLPDGREATRVRLRISRPARDTNLTLTESIPIEQVPSRALVGFEWAYPDQIEMPAPVLLQWNLPASSRGGDDERSYVVLRPITAAQAVGWTAPAIVRAGAAKNETGNPSGNGGAASGADSANANNSNAPAGAPASALRLDFGGVLGIGLLAPILFIGAATYLFRRMKDAREKKEE